MIDYIQMAIEKKYWSEELTKLVIEKIKNNKSFHDDLNNKLFLNLFNNEEEITQYVNQ
jgi:hypothetical protein